MALGTESRKLWDFWSVCTSIYMRLCSDHSSSEYSIITISKIISEHGWYMTAIAGEFLISFSMELTSVSLGLVQNSFPILHWDEFRLSIWQCRRSTSVFWNLQDGKSHNVFWDDEVKGLSTEPSFDTHQIPIADGIHEWICQNISTTNRAVWSMQLAG